MPVSQARIRALKIHRSYDVSELAELLGVHKNTIREWQRNGLSPVDERRPFLFTGAAVIAFLKRRAMSRKSHCPLGTIYCLRCRAPKPPALGMVDVIPLNALTGNATGLCASCEATMYRRVNMNRIMQVFPNCAVKIQVAPPRL